jgi:hypothetical protein
MPLWRNIIGYAVRRAASDPQVRARAADYYESVVKPRAQDGARRARDDWREIADEVDPRDTPARFAGRMVGRWRKRLQGDEEP